MGSFKTREVEAKERVKAAGRYVLNREWVPARVLEANAIEAFTDNVRSGTANTINSGADMTYLSMPASEGTTNYSGVYQLVVPVGFDRNVKIDNIIYWDSADSETDKAVVLDLDYTVSRPWTSGISALSGIKYTVSGLAASNVTTTSAIVSGVNSGLQTTKLTIPSKDVQGGDLIHVVVYRDADETADSSAHPIRVLGVQVEYVEE